MAEFQKVVKERNRMCEQYNSCTHCPLKELQTMSSNAMCRALAFQYPEEAERIIMQWASEHPIMTNRRKFKEVFGFALDEKYATPINILAWFDEEYKEGDSNG